MYKIFYLLCCMILLYIAGLFSSTLLTGFVLAMIITACFLYGTTCIFKKNATIKVEKTLTISKEEEISFPFSMHISSFFKPGLLRYHVQVQYNQKKPVKKYIDDTISTKPVFVGHDCGIYEFTLLSAFIYDWTRLFHRKLHFKNTTCAIVVLPDAIPILYPISLHGSTALQTEKKSPVSTGNELSMEIKDIREYQKQDSLKHIHWKQSARLQKYYVKEYEKEQGCSLVIKAVFDNEFSCQDLQFFYSVILGFLQQQVHITCYIEKTELYRFFLMSKEDLDMMFVSFLTKQALPVEELDPIYDVLIHNQQCLDANNTQLIF